MHLTKPRSWKLLLACLLVVGLFLPSTTTAHAAPATVTGVKVGEGSGVLNLEVGTSGSINYRVQRVSKPRESVVVQVWPAVLGSSTKTQVDVNRGLVEKVRLTQSTPDTVHIFVDVISQPEYRVSQASSRQGLLLAVSPDRLATTMAPKARVAPSEPVVAPAAVEVPRVAQAPRSAAPTAVRPAPAAPPAPAPRPAPRPKKRVAPAVKTVNLDFVNADLVYVVKILAKEMGKNVFIGPDVEGSVTVTLSKVPPEGALALILKMQEADLAYKVVDSTIVVASPEKLQTIDANILGSKMVARESGPSLQQEFLLEKAPSAKVVEFLTGQFPAVTFTAHPTMNGFFARGGREDLRSIKGMLGNLDVLPPAVAPPRREFIPVKYAAAAELMALVKTLVPDVVISVDERLQMLIVEGSDSAIEQLQDLLSTLDRPLEQVMLDVKVIDLTENGSKTLGVTWGSPQSPGTFQTTFGEVFQTQFNPVQGVVGQLGVGQPLQAANVTTFPIGSFVRSPFVIQSTLSFLVSNSDAKILAAPRVATQNGKEALIHVGDKFPIVFFDPRAGQFQVTYVDIGIKMRVKPEIKADGYIVAEMSPEVSNLVALVNNQYPQTRVRTVNSTMRIKDGDTMILGGLIREDEINNVSKIPLLGDLPIFGVMFRSTNATTTRNEVVLMMTPHIMK